MAQVSKRYLNPKVEQQIFDTFVESFSSLSSAQKATDFLYDHLLPPKGANWSGHYKRTSTARAKRQKAF